ncbi:hypothetical protein PCAR4_810075 [Paraburkholderia caribensis]|nr:hypothetical protein PCAR4_810075 [Paraburkholderia caribensis]
MPCNGPTLRSVVRYRLAPTDRPNVMREIGAHETSRCEARPDSDFQYTSPGFANVTGRADRFSESLRLAVMLHSLGSAMGGLNRAPVERGGARRNHDTRNSYELSVDDDPLFRIVGRKLPGRVQRWITQCID